MTRLPYLKVLPTTTSFTVAILLITRALLDQELENDRHFYFSCLTADCLFLIKLQAPWTASATDMRRQLHWLPVIQQIVFKRLTLR